MGTLKRIAKGLGDVGKATGEGINKAIKKYEAYNAAEPQRVDAAIRKEEAKLQLTIKKEKLAKLKKRNAPKQINQAFDIWSI
jgi:hypothetical protein